MRKGSYKHLNEHDRVRIEVYLKVGKSQYEIAGLLKVDKSTICREIKKRGGYFRGYTADYAQKDYEREKQKSGVKSKIENMFVGRYIGILTFEVGNLITTI
jgi:IS30 family transposase